MLLLLYGSDTHRMNQKLQAIWKRYQEVSPQGFRAYTWDRSSIDTREVHTVLSTQSMFQEKKLLVFFNVVEEESLADFFEPICSRFQESKETILVFIQEGEPKKKNSLFSFLVKHAAMQQHFPLLEGPALGAWVKKKGAGHGIQFEPKAVSMLCEWIGNDLWRLDQEIRKIAAYKNAKGTATAKDVELLVASSGEVNIFHTLEALSRGDKKRALEMLQRHSALGESPFQLFSMVVMQFRNLLLIQDMKARGMERQQISQQLKMHPYAFSKAYTLASSFSLEKLQAAYATLYRMDQKAKLGQEDLGRALELFTIHL